MRPRKTKMQYLNDKILVFLLNCNFCICVEMHTMLQKNACPSLYTPAIRMIQFFEGVLANVTTF